MSRKARKFKGFFLPKLGVLQKKKKKRSSPKFRIIFLPISQIQTFEGGSFRMGGAIFHFSQKIGLKSTKIMRFCILHKPMGGLEPPPPPPGYATADRHAPLKKLSRRQSRLKSKPCITKDLFTSINNKRRMFKTYYLSHDSTKQHFFKKYSNLLNRAE